MEQKGKTYKFKDRTARKTGGIRGGLAMVKVRIYRVRKAQLYLNFTLKAYGDLSAATEEKMAIHITFGPVGAFNEGIWTQFRKGWKLSF